MKKSKTKSQLIQEFDKFNSTSIDENLLSSAFDQLKKELAISKEIFITDSIYLTPFKLEYVENSGGLKSYFVGMEQQLEEKSEHYVKLSIKRDAKLIAIKSFGKVSNLESDRLNKLLLMIRLSQYHFKNRELYSLEIAIKQLLK